MGTAERPRLNVFRSLKHIYAQVIDDDKGVTLASASTLKLQGTGGNIAAAKAVGSAIAQAALEKGISEVVFDRGGYIYHGRCATLEISDHVFASMLKDKIAQNRDDIQIMRSTLYCGSKVLKAGAGYEPGVFVIANNETAKFWGTTTCKNAWICPVCSARMMSKYAAEIACAIDALKERGQVAFMITFTVPHTSGMTCEETTEILFDTFHDFHIRGNHNLKTRWNNKDPFATFCEEFNCKHRIRVGEYTWGAHGWHPHFHCLFFVDKDKLQRVKDWSDKLNERWLTIAKRRTVKIWCKLYPKKSKETHQKRADIMYNKADKVGSKGAYISVDELGNVIEQKSSQYICGWGADRELTGNYKAKATNEGHMTPYQILEKAFEEKHTKGAEAADKWLNLYMEFARAIKRKQHKRISFGARTGLRQIIAQHKNTVGYREIIKKKYMEQVAKVSTWKMVCWFSESQWLKICLLDRKYDVKFWILKLAQCFGRDAVKEYLAKFFEIHLIDRPNMSQEVVEQILNLRTA